jgi:hypothetical protein
MGTAVLAEYGPLPRLVVPGILIAALVSVPQYLRMHLRGYSAETKGPSMQSIVRIFAFFSVGLVIPILIHAAGWAPPPPS